ncbi:MULTISPECIES: non-ribosomal peptide synthetase [unclassified Streptomyces]|uniref:non-ribosomal peptide synthetase n=1 Tax=unclassified Streptomyces TaxID=2593676 RepID=UPI001905609B|nr:MULTISPECIES: non-ribosomal peptide synthetase [unclassified Streptomyces]MCU4749731.1 non-ribosomal peptide synthetase [Streptomyces sp. G-5]QQN76043.1 amino acid adenylation domain-containing protein [Streptomyces sp. XC 2026]
MSHVQVLREIEARGLALTSTGTDLRLQGPRDRMDTELLGLIRAHKADLIAHLGTPEGFPLTALQQSYLLGRGAHVEIGNVASHVYHEIEGAWDLDRLESALRTVVARHPALRTRFTPDGRQVTQSTVDVRVGRFDLRGASGEARREHRLALREERSHRVLPADTPPLLAADVTILAEDCMVLHIDHDGLIMDATSMFVFFRDWRTAYDKGDAAPRDTDEASFEAYVAALETARTRAPARRARAHWLERLENLAPHPDLPLRTSPSSIAVPRFTARFARMDAPRWAALKARAADRGLTPSALLFAVYADTLAAWGAGPRFTITTTVANRPPIHPRILGAVGNFCDTMLVEVGVDRSTSFADRARALQARLRRELDNRHFTGIEVLRELARRGSAASRMPYTFNSALGHGHAGVDGSALELFGPEVYTSSQTPQVWLDVSAFEQHGGIVVQFDSVDELFPDGLIEAVTAGYQRLLHALCTDDAWDATTFDLLPDAQRHRRRAANDTATPPPAPDLLTEAFLTHVRRAPDAPAIVTGTATWSYAALYAHAAHAAAWLRERNTAPDELVGLVMNRGPEQLIGILATLLAGAAYLPIDAALPTARRAYMLSDGRVRHVLTNTDGPPEPHGYDVLSVDATRPPPGPPPDPGAGPRVHDDRLAYVLYTSGTTGEPKGVMVSRASVANVVADCTARFRIGPADRLFGVSAFHFDLSVFDILGALSTGAAVVLPDADRATDPEHWLRLATDTGVTVWNSVPAIVSLLHEQAVAEGAGGPGTLPALRLVMMSGDRIPPKLPAALRALKPDLEIVSLGGPTETTIWNIVHPIRPDEDGSRGIPYGRPNANNRAYVLDEHLRDVPDWVTGDIWAAGTGLARGYWGDAARTAERFVHDPVRGERLYRTGDLGRFLPNGEIDILGRDDFQIKVNGHRIEAGEVESRLMALDGVARAVVLRQESGHRGALVAHLVPAGAHRPSRETIRAALREHLPYYMIPAAVCWHDSLPLTGNGKIDRARLADHGEEADPAAGVAAPDTEVERQVADVWARVLKIAATDLDVTRALYDLGGDSLAAARIFTAVRKRFGRTLTMDRLPEVDTVRTMAHWLGASQSGKAGRAT